MKWSIALGITLATAVAAAEPVEIDNLRSETPESWKAQPVTGMRKFQFRLPPEPDDPHPTELIVFFFGKGQGGAPSDNIARWKGMFEKGEPKVTEETIAGAKATIVEISGTYLFRERPMDPGPPTPRPGQRMIGVHFATPGGPYFMRLVGPDATVSKHKKAFLEFLRGFKPAR
jgi:hypothetical protein